METQLGTVLEPINEDNNTDPTGTGKTLHRVNKVMAITPKYACMAASEVIDWEPCEAPEGRMKEASKRKSFV